MTPKESQMAFCFFSSDMLVIIASRISKGLRDVLLKDPLILFNLLVLTIRRFVKPEDWIVLNPQAALISVFKAVSDGFLLPKTGVIADHRLLPPNRSSCKSVTFYFFGSGRRQPLRQL